MQGKPLTVTWYTQPQLPESLGWPVASPWTSRRAYAASSSDIFSYIFVGLCTVPQETRPITGSRLHPLETSKK